MNDERDICDVPYPVDPEGWTDRDPTPERLQRMTAEFRAANLAKVAKTYSATSLTYKHDARAGSRLGARHHRTYTPRAI